MAIRFEIVEISPVSFFSRSSGFEDLFEAALQAEKTELRANKNKSKPAVEEDFFEPLSLQERILFAELVIALLEQEMGIARSDVPRGYDYFDEAFKEDSRIREQKSQEKLNPNALSKDILTESEQTYGKRVADNIMASGKNHVLMGESHDAHPYPAIISTIEAARNKGKEVIYTLEIDPSERAFSQKIQQLQRNPQALQDPENFRKAVDDLTKVCPNSYDPADFSFSTVAAIAMGAKIELIDNWNMKSKQTRDAYMAEQLKRIYNQNPDAFVLSHFGAAHNQYKGESHNTVDEVNYDERDPLGKRLMDDGYSDGLLSVTTAPDAADHRGDYDMSFRRWSGDASRETPSVGIPLMPYLGFV